MKKTLYVHKKLLNTREFLEWAKSQGFENTLEAKDLHCTIAFSKKEVEWSTIEKDRNSLRVKGGQRSVVPLGDMGAVVLKFQSDKLTERWEYYKERGCSFDYESYTPHVTITYRGVGKVDLSKVRPYHGPLEFGPEIMKEVDLDWHKKK